MKLTCVGLGPARCTVLTLDHTHLLLDCGAWHASHPLAWLRAQAASQGAGNSSKQSQQGAAVPMQEAAHNAPAPASMLGPCLPVLGCFRFEAALLTTAASVLGLPYLLARYPGTSLIQGPIYATLAALHSARNLISELEDAQASHIQADTQPPGLPGAISRGRAGNTARTGEVSAPGPSRAATPQKDQERPVSLVPSSDAQESGAHLWGDVRLQVAQGCGVPVEGHEAAEVADACWHKLEGLDPAWVETCLRRVKAVRYGQVVSLDGVQMTARALPTGASMGAAMWIISDGGRNIGYVSDWQLPATPGTCLELEPLTLSNLDALITAPCCLRPPQQQQPQAAGPRSPPPPPPAALPSGLPLPLQPSPGALLAHQARPPMPPPGSHHASLPPQAPIAQAGLHPTGGVRPPGPPAMPPPGVVPPWAAPPGQPVSPQAITHEYMSVVQHMQRAVLSAVSQGASVLIPLPATGVAWSIILDVCRALQGTRLQGPVPVVYVSPAARSSLALATTSMEFMSRSCQGQLDLAIPFTQLMASKQLVEGACLGDPHIQQALQGTCVVVAPVSSLAGGTVWQLLQSWSSTSSSNRPSSMCLLCWATGCDPGQLSAALKAALGDAHVKVHVVESGVGGPPPASHWLTLLAYLQPCVRQLVMEEQDLVQVQPWLQQARSATVCHAYSWLDRVEVPLPAHVTQVEASPQLLQHLKWVNTGDAAGHVAARLTGVLSFHEGKWQLQPVPRTSLTPSSLATTALAAASRAANSEQGMGATSSAPAYFGQPTVKGVLQALAAQGLTDVDVEQFETPPPAQPHVPQEGPGAGPTSTRSVTRIRVKQLAGEIELSQGSAVVRGPDALAQKILSDAVSQQLTRL